MSFFEMYPVGFRDCAVSINEGISTTDEERGRLRGKAAEEAAKLFMAKHPKEALGAIVLAYHEDSPVNLPQSPDVTL